MVKFIGEYAAKVDDKGRVVFPSGLKDQMLRCQVQDGVDPEGIDWRFVLKKDLWEPCLCMYCFCEWERESESFKSKINFLNQEEASFWREYTRNRAVVEPEPKLGRISIPKTLLESIGADRELVFCGSDHKIEIWGKDQYERSGLPQESFTRIADSLSRK